MYYYRVMSLVTSELQQLLEKLHSRALPEDLRIRAERMIQRLQAVAASSGGSYPLQEYELVSKYVDWVLALPVGLYSQDNLDLGRAKETLDKHHYGLAAVKEGILEFIATRKLQQQNSQVILNSQTATQLPASSAPPVTCSPILCFIGVQGVGKTTMAKSIAACLGRNFERIALGAFASVHELRGRARSEAAAEPGQIVKALVRSKTMNPVILLDEIDKVSESSGLKADVMAALLEILDPEQNRAFVDRYLDYPLDLSQVIFIATANNVSGLSAALLDRLELIRFASYSDAEKQVIARDYLLPKVRKATGITAAQLEFSEDAWPLVIRPLGFDPGIRQLERNLTQLARKVAKMIVEGYTGKVTITSENFRQFIPEQISVFT